MSRIIDIARAMAATLNPITGDRATGTVTWKATGADVELRRNTYLIPKLDGQIRPDLLMKVGLGPGKKVDSSDKTPDGYWTITAAGTTVDILSNVGGLDMNLPAGTRLGLEFIITGIEELVTVDSPGMAGGTSPAKGSLGTLQSIVQYQQFSGPAAGVDAFRSRVKRFPALVIVWEGTEPADGTSTAQTHRATRVAASTVLYKETYDLVVITSRDDHDHMRRTEGLQLLDEITEILTDVNSIDGICFSNPGGLEIRTRAVLPLQAQAAWQQFYTYVIQISAMTAITRRDDRVFNPWLLTTMILQTPDNNLPNQGPLDVVDTSFDMPQPP